MENSEETRMVFNHVHDVSEERTEDVISDATFENLMIKPSIVETLVKYGYRKPSPVQAKSIPLGLLGMDMLVQAKTGTGKTLVFAVLCADHLLSATKRERTPLVMIVTPTREIAHQIYGVLRKICPPNFFHGLFVGGVDMEQDKTMLKKGCQVAIGTTGRLAHLVKIRALDLRKVSLFVLDEADKLMEDSFKNEVNFLFSKLPPQATQVCVFSATYPRDLEQTLCQYMVDPTLIRLNVEDIQLVGIKQYTVVDDKHSDVETLVTLLNKVTYSQCLIFSNNQARCNGVCDYLNHHEIRATHFSSSLSQEERFKVLKDLKNFKIRVLVSSDLSARGIDATNVNIVVNLECPLSTESYLHRIGRAGRFGTKGAAFTILSSPKEQHRFKMLSSRGDLRVKMLDLQSIIPADLVLNTSFFEKSKDFQIRQLVESKPSATNSMKTLTPVILPEGVELAPIPLRTIEDTTAYTREEMLHIRDQMSNKQWAEYASNHPDRFEVLHDVGNQSKKQQEFYKNQQEVYKKKKPTKSKENAWRKQIDDIMPDAVLNIAKDSSEQERSTSAIPTKATDSNTEEVIQPTFSTANEDQDDISLLENDNYTGYFSFLEEFKSNFKAFMLNRSHAMTQMPYVFPRKTPMEYEQHIDVMKELQNSEEKFTSMLKHFENLSISNSLCKSFVNEAS